MKLLSAILLFCIASSQCCFSQQRLHVPTQVCRFDYTILSDNSDLVINVPDNRVQQLWNNLLSASGMAGANATLRKSTNSKTFESFIQNGRGWIIYDDDMLNKWTQDPNYDWMVTFVLAHELAHFALGHNIAAGSNKEWEARADQWACQQLCRMKATTLQAAMAVSTFVSDRPTLRGYPTKMERIRSINHYFLYNDCDGVEASTKDFDRSIEYFYDFSDPANTDFYASKDGNGYIEIKTGKLYVGVFKGHTKELVMELNRMDLNEDFSISVVAKSINGENEPFGLIYDETFHFGLQKGGRFAVYNVPPDAKDDVTSRVMIGEWKTDKNFKINDANTITVQKHQNEIQLLLNDHCVYRHTLVRKIRVNNVVGLFASGSQLIEFDNFVIRGKKKDQTYH